jgi:hypothetical protein
LQLQHTSVQDSRGQQRDRDIDLMESTLQSLRGEADQLRQALQDATHSREQAEKAADRARTQLSESEQLFQSQLDNIRLREDNDTLRLKELEEAALQTERAQHAPLEQAAKVCT